jgi:hypothetical protein
VTLYSARGLYSVLLRHNVLALHKTHPNAEVHSFVRFNVGRQRTASVLPPLDKGSQDCFSCSAAVMRPQLRSCRHWQLRRQQRRHREPRLLQCGVELRGQVRCWPLRNLRRPEGTPGYVVFKEQQPFLCRGPAALCRDRLFTTPP